MSDEHHRDEHDPSRPRPFGERGNEERSQPFGARSPGRRPRPRAPYIPESESAPEPEPEPEPAPPPDDDPVQVPLVRIPAERPDEPPGDFVPDEDGFEPEPEVRGEPLNAPALIRVRDRRGSQPPAESILKQQASKEPSDAPAPEKTLPAIRFGVMARTIIVIFLIAGVIATLFTWWTPNTFLPTESVDQLSVALATQSSDAFVVPTAAPTPIPLTTSTPLPERIGIVSGHAGIYPPTGVNDPGAVCDDGLTEAEINAEIAGHVVEWLIQHGYQVDLFDEFDDRLEGYEAQAIVSIHADSCEYINDLATGFKVASFSDTIMPEEDARLVACMVNRYAETTGMTFHPSVTYDMTQYHTFREVAPGTPGVIIEVGFMYMDRELLEDYPEVVALGVARGLLCYLRNEPVEIQELPTPEAPETEQP